MSRKLRAIPPNDSPKDELAKRREKRPKAEPRVSLAPLEFEEALKGLLETKQTDPDQAAHQRARDRAGPPGP